MAGDQQLLTRLAKTFKTRWAIIAGVAAWLGSVIGAFLRDPPPSTIHDTTTVAKFGEVFLSLAVGLMYVPVILYRSRSHLRYWLISAVSLTLLAPVAYLPYEHYRQAWSAPFVGRLLLVGPRSALTPPGEAFLRDEPDASDEEILAAFGGDSVRPWSMESVERRRLALNLMYVFALPILAAGIISVLQAVDCATLHPTMPGRPSKKEGAAPAAPGENQDGDGKTRAESTKAVDTTPRRTADGGPRRSRRTQESSENDDTSS